MAAAGLAAQQRAQEPAPIAAKRAETLRPEILGTRGIVAAGRHYSVSAGVRILQQGGNAVDAGVASVLAASVCEISHFGFGGEAPTMIYDAKTREVIVVNGQGPAPKAAAPALFSDRGFVPGNGPLGATIPAMLDAMALALEAKGTMHLDQVMQPAIELADGFPMYEFLRNYLISERAATEQWEWSRKTYYPDGRVPDVGELFRQPNLARTLRTIAAADKAALRRFAPAAMRSTRATSRGASPTPTRPPAASSATTISPRSTDRSRSRSRRAFTATTSTRRARGIRGRCCCRRSTSSRASI
jgi:gamma-glutamyltranspeptidase / glutathione hydrolase